MSFDHLGLSPDLLRAVADEGYTVPTPVQNEAIPLVLAGRDLLAGAQTGTGKTAAFVLPILQLLASRGGSPEPVAAAPAPRALPGQYGRPSPARQGRPVRALVLAPTRELALQVEESVRTYGKQRPIRSVAIYGGVGFEPQVRSLRAGPAIVVATPGRLLDHVGRGTIDLGSVEILVLDEADRMLDMGFIRDIRRILELLPRERQNLLFSATFSDEIRSLAGGLLDRPAMVDVAPRNTAAELVEQLVIPVDRTRKKDLLVELIRSGRVSQALVFTRTKHGANRLAEQLERDGIRAAAIHGNKSQGQRVRALDDLKSGRADILVATDIAARGIDIDALPYVVNFELPMVAADYVHRIGRTGRAGTGGQAISLVCIDEGPLLREIERLLRRTLPAEVIAGFEPDRNARPEPIQLRSGQGARTGYGAAGHATGHAHAQGRQAPRRPRQAAAPVRGSVGIGNGRPAVGAPGRSGHPSGGPSRPAHPAGPARVAHGAPRPAQGIGNGDGQGRQARDGSGVGRPNRHAGGARPMHQGGQGRQGGAGFARPGQPTGYARPAQPTSGGRQQPNGFGRPAGRSVVALPGERLSRASMNHERAVARGED